MTALTCLGTGIMGSAMTTRFLATGCAVTVWNRTSERADELIPVGASVTADPVTAVAASGLVIVALADAAAVAEVLTRPDVMNALQQTMVLQTSTISARDTVRIRTSLPVGSRFVDCPIIGNCDQIREGAALALAGADPGDVPRAAAILRRLGKVVHVGDVGAASAMKTVINAVVSPMIAVLAEGLMLAHELGLDDSAVFDVLAHTRAAPLAERNRRRVQQQDYSASSRMSLAEKDLRVVTKAATDLGVDATMAQAALDLLTRASASGLGDDDVAALVPYLRHAYLRHGPASG